MEFLTTKGIAGEIEKIIREAEDFAYIISPYVKIDKTFKERFLILLEKNIKVFFTVRLEDKDKMHKIIKQFNDEINLTKIDLFACENLHAKCYLNEKQAIVTSMNLYDYSEKNNYEIGIKITKEEHEDIFRSIHEEAKNIKKHSQKFNFETNEFEVLKSRTGEVNNNTTGYCIRCRREIDFNLAKPLCDLCYKKWKEYKNENYLERFCHKCEKTYETTFAKCLCDECGDN